MKRLLISVGVGLLLLCIWGAIVVATSQDFAHEGPHGFWASPFEAWSRFLIHIGWSQWLTTLSPIPKYVLGFTMLFGPFVLALSAVAHIGGWLLRKLVHLRNS